MTKLAVELVFSFKLLAEITKLTRYTDDKILRDAYFDPKPDFSSDRAHSACNVHFRYFDNEISAGDVYKEVRSEHFLLSHLLLDPIPGTKETFNEYVDVKPKSRILKVWADLNEFHMQVVRAGFNWENGQPIHQIRFRDKEDWEARVEYLKR